MVCDVLAVTALRLRIPADVVNPERLARQIIDAWPARSLIAKYKVQVLEDFTGVKVE